MKLEVIDKWNPIFCRVATVVDIAFHQIKVLVHPMFSRIPNLQFLDLSVANVTIMCCNDELS